MMSAFGGKADITPDLPEMSANDPKRTCADPHGKIRGEAEAEILKAIELTEFACSLPQIASAR